MNPQNKDYRMSVKWRRFRENVKITGGSRAAHLEGLEPPRDTKRRQAQCPQAGG